MGELIKLFLSFFQIGLFSFGGGYAAMSLIKIQVVGVNNWINVMQFTDLITISQMTPGPIALNSATFVGLQVAGLPGALVSTIGNIVPSFIVVSILAYVYFKYQKMELLTSVLLGIRPIVVAMIGSAGITILLTALWGSEVINFAGTDLLNLGLFAISLFALRKFRLDPILVMVMTGVVGVVLQFFA